MQGRAYLDLARELVTGTKEWHWRGAVGRAYYALFLECREALSGWRFHPSPRENIHTFVRLRFTYPSDPDIRNIGDALDWLGRQRNKADYDLSALAVFTTSAVALTAVQNATTALALLDAIEADPPRRSGAIGAIQKAFP
jgi:hypothetical protein